MIRIFFSFSSMGLEKNSIGTRLSPKKKLFLFLATIPLWCVGIRKKLFDSTPYRNIFFLTTVLLCCMRLRKDSIGNHPPLKKKYFCFWLQYDYGAWNLENIQSAIDTGSKKLFSFLSSSTTWTWCMGLGLTQSVLDLHH